MTDQYTASRGRFAPVGVHTLGRQKPKRRLARTLGAALAFSAALTAAPPAAAQAPEMLDSRLIVRTVVSGLSQPTNMAFLGPNDFLVLEKATGRVQRVV